MAGSGFTEASSGLSEAGPGFPEARSGLSVACHGWMDRQVDGHTYGKDV